MNLKVPETNLPVKDPMVEISSKLQRRDKDGVIYPWFNPPSLKFLEGIVQKDWEVFEWGSGAGTYWFSLHTKNIISVEHHKSWADWIVRWAKERGIQNININLVPLEKDDRKTYPHFILTLKKFFDLIIIDGRERVECSKYAKRWIKDLGWIILDNSDRLDLYPIEIELKDMQKIAFKTHSGWGTSFFQNTSGGKEVKVATMEKHEKLLRSGEFKVSPEGGIKPAKGWILDSLLRKLSPSKILEIGFNQGRSSMLMLEVLASKKPELISIDIGKHESVYYNSSKMKEMYQNFDIVVGDSKEVLRKVFNRIGEVDFAMVDGGHDYKTCLSDIKTCLEYLSPGGIIYVDDYNKYNSLVYKAPGVEKACDEMKEKCYWKLYSEEGIMLFSKDRFKNGT